MFHFEIKDFCSLYSDAHSVIEFPVKSQVNVQCRNENFQADRINKRWEEPEKQLFVETLDHSKIQEVMNKLNNTTQQNKENINNIMSDIEDIFKTTRNNTFTKNSRTSMARTLSGL